MLRPRFFFHFSNSAFCSFLFTNSKIKTPLKDAGIHWICAGGEMPHLSIVFKPESSCMNHVSYAEVHHANMIL